MKKHLLFLAMLTLAACSRVSTLPEPYEGTAIVRPLLVSSDPANAVPNKPAPASGIPVPSTVKAGYDQTRTYLQGTPDGGAKVFWSPGDSFMSFWLAGDLSGYSNITMTTSGSGAYAEFSSDYSLPDGLLYSFYPGVGYGLGITPGKDKKVLFDLELPSKQTAVEGGVANGVNLSFASSTVFGDELRFHNIPSLIRFRLSGSVVSRITSITIRGKQQLAGHMVFTPSGESLENSYYSFGGDTYTSVTLSGTFREGADYYVAVFPGTQKLTVVFSDGADGSTTLSSGKEIPLSMGRIADLGSISLGNDFRDPKPIRPVLYNEASSNLKPVTIAVIPEGFTHEQMSTYDALARAALETLFATEPYKSYREYFNAWILYAFSKESGASVTDGNGNITLERKTAFGARWGASSYGDMKADGSEINRFLQETCPDLIDGSHSCSEVPVLMIINDSRYGGICSVSSEGDGYAMVPYTDYGGPLTWGYPSVTAVSDTDPAAGIRNTTQEETEVLGINVGDWRNIVVHEFGGHCFGRLADEYWHNDSYKSAVSSISTHTWPVPFGLNVSATCTDVPWQKEILDNLDDFLVLDSRYSRIGIWQGGDTSPINRWRSEKISCMIDNRFYFSTWQRALIVKRIMQLAGGSFELYDFVAKDNPADPVRDKTSASAPAAPAVKAVKGTAAPRPVPPLPPPVLNAE